MKFSCQAVLLMAVATAGCADLALEPNQVATSMVITPADTLITTGDQAKLTVTVLDQDGNPIPEPPSWAPPEWIVSEPDAIDIAPNGSLTGLLGGNLTVTANLAGLEAWTGLRVNPSSLVLSASTIHLNQVVQNKEGSVPIIAGRKALLRVFVTGDQVSFYQPRVQATFFQDGEVVHVAAMQGSDVLPRAVEEGRLDRSFNAAIPGTVLQPGVEIVVELDPDGVVPVAPGSQPRVPAEGSVPLDVVVAPRLDQTIVPVLVASSPDERIFNWTRGMTPESRQLILARTALPIGEMTVTVHEPYYTSADLTTENGWYRFIREIRTMWFMEGQKGYYYGALELPPGSRWGGLGFVGSPHVSVGRASEGTFAHELGHNMNLRHAPCGSALDPDPDYPYDDGSTGVWGYDFKRARLVDPEQYKDLMGYCSPDWISDFHFIKALEHRAATEGAGVRASPDRGPPERTLLLWGSAGNGELLLEPAFMVDAPVTLPAADGPYLLEGFGPGGQRYFSFAFTPDPVEFGGAHFLFAVPHDPERDGALERVVLSGSEGSFTLGRSGASPMAIITNRASGQVRAIVRDWSGGFSLLDGNTEIMVSDGLPGGGR